jgi:hypothetical protein
MFLLAREYLLKSGELVVALMKVPQPAAAVVVIHAYRLK